MSFLEHNSRASTIYSLPARGADAARYREASLELYEMLVWEVVEKFTRRDSGVVTGIHVTIGPGGLSSALRKPLFALGARLQRRLKTFF